MTVSALFHRKILSSQYNLIVKSLIFTHNKTSNSEPASMSWIGFACVDHKLFHFIGVFERFSKDQGRTFEITSRTGGINFHFIR